MIDTQTPQSPGWWAQRLLKQLNDGKPRYDLLERHYRGTSQLPLFTNRNVRDAYHRLMEVARTNYAELVVEATRERMNPLGFRTGASSDALGDKAAWALWQANDLDTGAMLVHRSMLSMGDSYVIVGPTDPDLEVPLVTVEDPREVVVEQDPRNRRKTLAALKAFRDDTAQQDCIYLYLPGYVMKATRPYKSGISSDSASLQSYEWEGDPQELPTKDVPVVRFANRPDHTGRSWGEFETHLSLLNRINYGVLQRLEVVTLQAFRQRAIKSDELPTHDENGDEIDYDDLFSADPGALWRIPSTADLWESGVVDLTPIQGANKDDVQNLAAVTRTPLFYLTPDAANGSAEGATLAREGLVFKTSDRIRQTSDPWAKVMSLAFTFAGDAERASRKDMQVIWADPERFSITAKGDAAAKAIAGGMTWRTTMEKIWQFTPDVIARMETERHQDALIGLTATPDATETPVKARIMAPASPGETAA